MQPFPRDSKDKENFATLDEIRIANKETLVNSPSLKTDLRFAALKFAGGPLKFTQHGGDDVACTPRIASIFSSSLLLCVKALTVIAGGAKTLGRARGHQWRP